MAIDFADLAIRTDYSSVDKAAASLDKLAAASKRADDATSRMGSSSGGASRQIGAWDSVQRRATEGVDGHVLATGRLTRAFEHMVVSATGVNREAALLATVLGDFAVGGAIVAGVVGGLALIVTAYDKITESARKAREEHDKLSKSLREENDATRTGPESVRNRQFRAEQETYNGLVGRRDLLQTYGARDDDKRIIELNRKIDESYKNLSEYATHQVETHVLPTVTVTSDIAHQRADAERERARRDREQSEHFLQVSEAEKHHREDLTAARQLSPVSESLIKPLTGQLTDEQMRLIGSIIKLDDEYDRAKGVFHSTTAAVDDFKRGVKQAATNLLEALSPGNLAQGVIGNIEGKVQGFISGLVDNAIGGIRHAVLGQSGAERDAQRQAAASAHAMALQIDEVTKALGGDQLGAAIDALQIGLIQSLQAINDAMPGSKNEAARNAAREQAARQEAEQEAQARRRYAEQQQYATEDLAVRNLRATGQGDAADLLAFREKQERELQAAIDANKDATYINTLRMVENNELIAFQNGLLQDAIRNAPIGFYGVAGYTREFATPEGPSRDSDIVNQKLHRKLPTGGTGPRGTPVQIQLMVDGRVLTAVVIDNIDQYASSTNGTGTSRSAALDTMPKR